MGFSKKNATNPKLRIAKMAAITAGFGGLPFGSFFVRTVFPFFFQGVGVYVKWKQVGSVLEDRVKEGFSCELYWQA